eukprot:3281897-Amphidinium_carterae.1
MQLHQDAFNLPGQCNFTLVMGTFRGGRVWLQEEHGKGRPPPEYLVPPSRRDAVASVKGKWLDVNHGEWYLLPHDAWHGLNL